MAERPDAPAHPSAKTTGAFYLSYFLTAIFAALLVARGLVVYDDAVNLIANVFYLVVTVLFYRMFAPINDRLSLIAAFFSIVGSVTQTLALVHLAPLHLSPFLFFGLIAF